MCSNLLHQRVAEVFTFAVAVVASLIHDTKVFHFLAHAEEKKLVIVGPGVDSDRRPSVMQHLQEWISLGYPLRVKGLNWSHAAHLLWGHEKDTRKGIPPEWLKNKKRLTRGEGGGSLTPFPTPSESPYSSHVFFSKQMTHMCGAHSPTNPYTDTHAQTHRRTCARTHTHTHTHTHTYIHTGARTRPS